MAPLLIDLPKKPNPIHPEYDRFYLENYSYGPHSRPLAVFHRSAVKSAIISLPLTKALLHEYSVDMMEAEKKDLSADLTVISWAL